MKKIKVDISEPSKNKRIICPKCLSPKLNIFWRGCKNEEHCFYLENQCENGHKFSNADIMNQEGLFEGGPIVEMDVSTNE